MTERVRVGSVADFPIGTARQVDAGGTPVLVVATPGGLCGTATHCPHMNLPMTRGPGGVRVEGGTITCPWHLSKYDACTGENIDWAVGLAGREMPRWSRKMLAMGRTPHPIRTYAVEVEGDDVYVTVTSV